MRAALIGFWHTSKQESNGAISSSMIGLFVNLLHIWIHIHLRTMLFSRRDTAPMGRPQSHKDLPAVVAALTAFLIFEFNTGLYSGLNAMVKALSTIYPWTCVPKSADLWLAGDL